MLRFFCCFFSLYIFFTFSSQADFFQTCGLNSEDLSNIDYVLKNSNSKFIPREIDDINNETFKQALYLLSFYKNETSLPEEMINVIGFDAIKQISRFRNCAINYAIKTGNGNEKITKNMLNNFQFSANDYLFVLKNKYFQSHNYSDKTISKLLQRVLFEKEISYNDLLFLREKYKKQITDEMILQQIRFRFWDKKIQNIDNLTKMIESDNLKDKIKKMKRFYLEINKTLEKTIKLKNGKTKKVYKPITLEKKRKICQNWIKYDEYIDLVCLENDKKNTKLANITLKMNLNPKFLPEKWLKHRLYYTRDVINNEKDISDEVYDIIANAGVLYSENAFTQQFLAGFVAYLRKDYNNAIFHFKNCTNIAKYAEYNSKAYYWLGLSYKHLGSNEMANEFFSKGKLHTFTMYGQLSATEVGEDPERNIEDYILSFHEQPNVLCNDLNFVLGYLDQYKNKTHGLSSILSSYIHNTNEGEKIFNALMVVKHDFHKQAARAFGLYALRFNIADNEVSFPTTEYEDDSLLNAVIKKESNFQPHTIGGCGERGLMQIMPSTGKILAKNMGIKYDHKKLLVNDEYNVNMGKFYLENLLSRFNDNKLLTLAAYNAGGSNVEKWIKKNGDPREMQTNDEVVEWIEKIPFAFTRTYVAYILGFEMVYDVIKKINSRNV